MQQQQSFQGNPSGVLYLVPTPIGNLEDMTFRAIRIMKEADLIAAEDTRQTKKLCNYFEIDTQVVSYHEHNKDASGERLLEDLQSGKTIALVSDAGMPSISDPGYDLVVKVLEQDVKVVPLPGANAALTALIASGLPAQPFYFYGFLDRSKKERKKQLEALKHREETIILYESPHRLKDVIKDMITILGNRKVVLSRELTKKFEEFLRGDLEEMKEWFEQHEARGEFCLIVDGNQEEKGEAATDESDWWESLSIVDHVDYYINEKKLKSKEAIKQTASDRGVHKRDIYRKYHVEE